MRTERTLYVKLVNILKNYLGKPYEVLQEVRFGNLNPDIVVFKDDKIVAVIEVKKDINSINPKQLEKYKKLGPVFVVVNDKYYKKGRFLI